MCDPTEREQEGFSKESALRAYYQRLEVGHKHVEFLQSLHQWDLRSIKERAKKGSSLEEDTSSKDGERIS